MLSKNKRKRLVPKGWKKINLGKEFKTSSGATPLSSEKRFYENGTIPWINSGELASPYIYESSNYITQEGFDNSSTTMYPPNTVLVAMYGATAGKASLLKIEACTNQAICAIFPNDNYCPQFIKYSIDNLYDHLVGISSGSARDNLSQAELKDLELIVPQTRKEQEVLASTLSLLDKKIELNRQINDNLEAMAKQLYDYWFVQFDFPNEEGKPYKSSGGAMVWNEKLKREIPQGWDSSMLQSICTIKRGASPRPIDDFMDESHKGMPWVKISDATNSNSPFMTTIKEHIILGGVPKSVKVIPNTLIVSNSATPGIPKFIQIEACVHDGWLVLTDYQEIYKYYLYYVIKMIRHNLLHIASGSIFKNLKTDYLKEFICITPSTEILSKY